MRRLHAIQAIAYTFCLCGTAAAADEGNKSPLPTLSKEELIKLALSAAPPKVAKNATVMIPGSEGQMVEVRTGTNGFTCVPDLDGQEVPDPFCGDEASFQWADDYMNGAPEPTNTEPGVAYMAQGGWHWEKNGRVLMQDEDKTGATRVKEPPHWMIFWPFSGSDSGLPSLPGDFGAYVMFDDTPYAHLMIYQDPMKIK